MRVTEIRVCSTRGDNRMPGSGYVTFSDGFDCYWSADRDGSGFHLGRECWSQYGYSYRRSTRAGKKRTAALRAALER